MYPDLRLVELIPGTKEKLITKRCVGKEEGAMVQTHSLFPGHICRNNDFFKNYQLLLPTYWVAFSKFQNKSALENSEKGNHPKLYFSQ